MASRYVTVLNKVLYFLLFVSITRSSKLNVPHVLLPIFNELNVNFTLEAVNGGCYKWTTTRVDLVTLNLIDPKPGWSCSRKAVVSAISKEKTRNVAVVLAEEVNSQLVLRVDVIVDIIDSLSISTTTKEIIMDEVPEIFKVIAFDNQGNQFTTLEGVEFDWKILCLGASKDLTVLRFMRFRDSPYETPSAIEAFEEQNKRGHIVLLEGIKTGMAKVEVKLPYEEYAFIRPQDVPLSVVANLIILPATLYCMVYDVVEFKIYSLNNGKVEEIITPNTQYHLVVESKVFASGDTHSGEITALKEGRTRIVLHDRNVDVNDPNVKLPSATLYIVQPAYMTLTLFPHNNWEILLSEHHDIVVDVFSSDNHKLYLGPTVELHIQVGEIFHIQQRSANGSWLTGWAHHEGVAPVQAVLEGIVHPRLGRSKIEPLTAAKDIIIYPRIILTPSEVILPWDPISKPKYLIDVTATGGDGKFLWTSSNHSIGLVNQVGQVRTHSSGYFEVAAVMQRNHNNRETSRFHILTPYRLEIVEYVSEAEVGSPIHLHVALYGEKKDKSGLISHIPFTRCQDLPFKVQTSDENFVYNRTCTITPVGLSCANVAIIGNSLAMSKVTVSYNKDGNFLEDTVTVSTYKPLLMLYPTEDVVLAVGTTKQLIFVGGPRPSPSRIDTFSREVRSSNRQVVEAIDSTEFEAIAGHDDNSVIRVVCRALGEAYVTLSIVNSPMIPACKNPAASVTVKVYCAKPRSVSLQPEIKVADAESCPMDLSAEKVVVESNQDIELDVTVRDENGLRFLNISSLKFEWSTTPGDAGIVMWKNRITARDKLVGSLNYGDRSYQVITPKTGLRSLTVHAKIVGYLPEVLKSHKVKPEHPPFLTEEELTSDLPVLETMIGLYLVDDTVVTPDEIILYNHPGNKIVLPIKQGSGYYKLVLSSNFIADVKYLSNTKEVEIKPVADGDLRIQLIDLCLESKPAIITVQVLSVHIIRVEMTDKVEVGKCIPAIVRLYDESDNLLSLPDIDIINLRVGMEHHIANAKRLTPSADEKWGDGEVHYVFTGQELGDTKVTFSVLGTKEEVSSAPLDLQVFPPLVLYPRNATLVIGSSLHFFNKGGPQPESTLEFSVTPENVAALNDIGILKGLVLGGARVKARAIGTNPTTGQKVIYSQDTADVTVIPILGVRIAAPLTRFKVGSKVPVWAIGMPDLISPMIIGATEDSMSFNWQVDDPNIIQLRGVFEQIGITYGSNDKISTRVIGISPGRTKLRLNVTVPGHVANCPDKPLVQFSDAIDIEIFEGLVLLEPKDVSSRSVLMAPHSSLRIMTNMDGQSQISYKLIGEDSSDSQNQRSLTIPNPLVTITEDGVLQSHGMVGYSMVLVMAYDDHGLKQTLSLIVEVKPIYYMLLNVVANWMIRSDVPSDVIPLGAEFQLRATYHDSTGVEFTAGTSQLHVRTSRFDLTRVKQGKDNSTLILSMKKPGDTVLKVWADGLKKTADYIKLHVKQTVAPSVDHLVTGDVVCLWTPVTSVSNIGKWSSSDSKLLSVEPETGIGTVSGQSGSVAVLHTLLPVASLQMNILPINHIRLLNPDSNQILTNSESGRLVEVPLVIHSETSESRKNNLITSWHCRDKEGVNIKSFPFTCNIVFSNSSLDVPISNIFTVHSGFNLKTGLYSCNIVSTGVNDATVSVLETNVIVTAHSVSNDVVSNPVEIAFHPALFYETELVLDDDSFSGDLVIVGSESVLKDVSVTAADGNLLGVYDVERTTSNQLKHNIKLLDYHWKLSEFDEPLTLNLHSKVSDERGKVHVKIASPDRFSRHECAAGGRTALSSIIYNYRQFIAIVASMLVIFFVTFYAYSYYIQPIINVNIQSNGSLLTGASTVTPTPPSNRSPNASIVQRNCPTSQGFMRSSPNASYGTNLSGSYANREPVYGDPSNFYSTSPEVRRNRRLM
ncbi:nuclear pore membrane glycoprotein [Holotrichia oblita]|uniref:Nuclear pore membrane glycoprotein n=1 Tax=Holotrichia oblita TaxID=644536 RepID=A0ACB9TPZ3_HOLOL|nr:nuclear pore membrane glycoprotein [Holotrichia oblita]